MHLHNSNRNTPSLSTQKAHLLLKILYVDQMLFDANADIVTPRQAVEAMFPYIEKQLSQGVYLNHIVRHILGAFQNCKGARQWRRYLSENAFKQGAGIEVVETALSFVETN